MAGGWPTEGDLGGQINAEMTSWTFVPARPLLYDTSWEEKCDASEMVGRLGKAPYLRCLQ